MSGSTADKKRKDFSTQYAATKSAELEFKTHVAKAELDFKIGQADKENDFKAAELSMKKRQFENDCDNAKADIEIKKQVVEQGIRKELMLKLVDMGKTPAEIKEYLTMLL